MSSSWQREQVRCLNESAVPQSRVLSSLECVRPLADTYLWDPWPVRIESGEVAVVDGVELWMALSADASLDPGERHNVARIRLLSNVGGVWRDQGNLFPTGSSLGSREWAGCATYFPERDQLEVCYTASGMRGEQAPSFIQRIVRASGRIQWLGTKTIVEGWSAHTEFIKPGNAYQSTLKQLTGSAGFIKGFRDPFRFIDPADEQLYVLFTANQLDSTTDFDGVVGAATGGDVSTLELLPPLVTADGVNNELERPHVVLRDGLYYLFFSTQRRTFHPDLCGPTGLYGFVSDSMQGTWHPLNDSGLVFANPAEEPFQCYSWLVMSDLSVVAFVDFPNLGGLQPETLEAQKRARHFFSGAIAPRQRLRLQGSKAQLELDEVFAT